MPGKNFHEVIQLIRKDDPRYQAGAYVFMRQALDFTLRRIQESEKSGGHRHVTGAELCEGIRDFALEQYGPMAKTLLEAWGIQETRDFGHIVFNLVEFGIFGKTETDCLEDFHNVYSFSEAFEDPFRPRRSPRPAGTPTMSQHT